jgi:hypothetical protein
MKKSTNTTFSDSKLQLEKLFSEKWGYIIIMSVVVIYLG